MSGTLSFELRLISVSWSSKTEGHVEKMAPQPLAVEQISDRLFSVETILYPRIGGEMMQPAVSSASQDQAWSDTNRPQILDPKRVNMVRVQDAEGRAWWVEEGWREPKDKARKPRHESHIIKTAGTARVETPEGHIIYLTIIPDAFDEREYRALLAAFRGDLFGLIIRNNATVRGKGGTVLPYRDQRVLQLMKEFMRFVRQAMRRPDRLLRTVSVPQKIHQVRPNPQTFRDIARQGGLDGVTVSVRGRGVLESIDTPVNRYLAYITARLLSIVEGLARYDTILELSAEADVEQLSIADDLEIIQERLDASKTRWKEQRDRFIEEYASLRSDTGKAWRMWVQVGFEKHWSIVISADKVIVPMWILGDDDNTWRDPVLSKSLFMFEAERFQHGIFESGYTYKLECQLAIPKTGNKLDVNWVGLIEQLENGPKSTVKSVRKTTQPNTDNEQLEEKGKVQRKKNIERAVEARDEARESKEQLKTVADELGKIVSGFSKRGIRPDRKQPGSLVFFNNPAYSGARTAYRKLLELAELDDTLLDAALTVRDFGMGEMNRLYENWCLLRVIDHLQGAPDNEKKGLGFTVEDDRAWKKLT